MKRFTSMGMVLVLCGLMAACSLQKATSAMAAAGGSARAASLSASSTVSVTRSGTDAWASTRKVEVADPQYQMTAYMLDVPASWKFAGAIVRPAGCHANGAGLKYTLESADHSNAIVLLPGVTWSWNTSEQKRRFMDQAHCPGIDIDSAASFLVNIAVPNLHPNAKIMEVLPLLPEGQAALAKQLEQMKEQNAQLAARYNQPPQQQTLDGARVRVQFDRDGRPTEEMVVAVVQCFVARQMAMFNQPASEQRTCNSRSTAMFRAPIGKLDAFLALPGVMGMAKATQINHDWDNRLAADAQAAFQRAQTANNAQFQAGLKANQAAFDQRIQQQKQFDANLKAGTDRAMAIDRQRQNAIDASAHNTVLYSLDRQDFKNPNTGQTIEASSQFNHQWVSTDGSTLIQTNDHGFDPNGQVYPVSQSWTELVPQ